LCDVGCVAVKDCFKLLIFFTFINEYQWRTSVAAAFMQFLQAA